MFYNCIIGLRKGIGCNKAIEHVSDYIYKLLDKRKTVMATFLNLAKAFDMVTYDILLDKLCKSGIRGTALK